MSQLVVRPGRNAAREAKRLKEVRKVKGAILWNQRERTKRQKLVQERWETKQAVQGKHKWLQDNVYRLRREALANAKEDWHLGHLRPNRAVGVGADKYGALKLQQVQKAEWPVHVQKRRNEVRARQNLELEYPLIVDDKKYFPFAVDDRVVVIKGRDKGKIGRVRDIVDGTHEAIITGVNKV
jgi:large subunit ribosomal protein L24